MANPSWLDKQMNCNQCVTRPIILPALANTFDFLTRFHPTGLKTFPSDRLAVWISPPWLDGTPSPWLLPDIPLSSLYEASRCSDPTRAKALELNGSDALKVSEYINKMINLGYAPIFTEGHLKLQVVDRWLLPDEAAAGCAESSNLFPAANLPTPDFQRRCQPSDGLLPIPTATPLPPLH